MKSALRSPQLAIAFVAAVVVLLSAWLLPLPRPVLSNEEEAAKRMPQTQEDVDTARATFESVQKTYQGYVATHDVGAALTELEKNVTAETIVANAPILGGYLQELRRYLQGGNDYFSKLSYYDNELMAWTRSLGAGSEVLRPDTWPIVEYLKLYPPPTGLKEDYQTYDISVIQGEIDFIARLSTTTDKDTLAAHLLAVRSLGRSIEYAEGLNAGYATLLDNYHTRLAGVASNAAPAALSGTRALLATATNSVLALILLAGLAALFLSRKTSPKEAIL